MGRIVNQENSGTVGVGSGEKEVGSGVIKGDEVGVGEFVRVDFGVGITVDCVVVLGVELSIGVGSGLGKSGVGVGATVGDM